MGGHRVGGGTGELGGRESYCRVFGIVVVVISGDAFAAQHRASAFCAAPGMAAVGFSIFSFLKENPKSEKVL